MKSLAIAALCSLALLATPVTARPPTTHPVAEFVSEIDEPLDDFALRIAPALEAYTAQTRHEVCGRIAQTEDATRFSVRLITTKGALSCYIPAEAVMDGYHPLRLTIHSHPAQHSVMPTAADLMFFQNEASEGRADSALQSGRAVPLGRVVFSKGDMASGPGFLVVRGKLFYQEGEGTQREVGQVTPSSDRFVAQTR